VYTSLWYILCILFLWCVEIDLLFFERDQLLNVCRAFPRRLVHFMYNNIYAGMILCTIYNIVLMSQSFPFLLLTPRNMGLFVCARVSVDVLFLSIFPTVCIYIRSVGVRFRKRGETPHVPILHCFLRVHYTVGQKRVPICIILQKLVYRYTSIVDKVNAKRWKLSTNIGVPAKNIILIIIILLSPNWSADLF